MGEIKPLGSEKLQGDAKLRRILELTYYKSTEDSAKSSEVIKESTTGVYGIVKEKDGYYVKKGLNENSLDYIGGMFMKNKNRFSSYAEALKKLEFLTEQEQLQEATRYILKKSETQKEAPLAAPTTDVATPPAPEGEMPPAPEGETPPASDETGFGTDELGGEDTPEGDEEGDSIKSIERLAGKLGEKLRSLQDELESEDIKSAINSVLSAVDFSKLEDKDKDEILDYIEKGGEESFDDKEASDMPTDELGSEMGGEEEPAPETAPAPEEDELGETMDTLENLVNTQFEEGGEMDPDVDFKDEDLTNDLTSSPRSFEDENKFSDTQGLDFSDISPEEEMGGEYPEEEMGGEMSMTEEDPFKDDVKEIDINELTDIVHKGVKETLSKYFNQ